MIVSSLESEELLVDFLIASWEAGGNQEGLDSGTREEGLGSNRIMNLSSTQQIISVKPIKAHPSRRGTIRVALALPVELVFSHGTASSIQAIAIDIGMAGMCVQTKSIIDADAIASVRVSLGGTRVSLKVASRWSVELGGSGSPATGLVFEDLDEMRRNALWDTVQQRGLELGAFLTSCEGLDQLNFEESLDLAFATRLREVERGGFVYNGGDEETAAAIRVLLSGGVALEPVNGRFNQQIAIVRPRELFGGLPVVAGCLPFERAVATEKSMVLEFSGYAVENLLNTKPHLGVTLIRAASFHWMRRFADLLSRSISCHTRRSVVCGHVPIRNAGGKSDR